MNVRTLILGAGLCGMSAAYHLQRAGAEETLVLERNDEPGGLARTETYAGFSFDHSIHILYTTDDYVASWICDDLLRDNLNRQARHSFCHAHGVYTEYPYQLNNYGLPADVIVENVMGLIDAHRSRDDAIPPANYRDWIYQTFGQGIADNFMIPYNTRQWAWDLELMSFTWVADRVPMPALEDVIRGALQPPRERVGPNRDFWYPRAGGIEALSQAVASTLPDDTIRFGSNVVEVDAQSRVVRCADGFSVGYDNLVSTIPLPVLIDLIAAKPDRVTDAAEGLANNVVHTVNIGLRGKIRVGDDPMHWVYFPHEDTIFHRISFPHEFSEWMAPPGCSSIQAEISESSYRPVDREALVDQTLAGLCRVGLLTEDEARHSSEGGRVEVAEVVTLDPAYIIYDLWHEGNTTLVAEWLQSHDIETRGRFGEWEYFNMDHSLLSGKTGAEASLRPAAGLASSQSRRG